MITKTPEPRRLKDSERARWAAMSPFVRGKCRWSYRTMRTAGVDRIDAWTIVMWTTFAGETVGRVKP